jgi:tRNA(fMet)-specific endonuclease VapC
VIYALDANIVVELLRQRDPNLHDKYLANSPGDYRIPEMVRAELLFGAKVSARPEENTRTVKEFLAPILLLPFSGEAVEHYADIRSHLEKSGLPIGPNDLVIAATARAHNLVLITRNAGEFSRVPSLTVEYW